MKETYEQQHARTRAEPPEPVTLAQLWRKKYGSAYDDLSDLELERSIHEAHPGAYRDLPQTNDASKLPTRPIEVPPDVNHNMHSQDALTNMGQAWQGVKNAASAAYDAVAPTVKKYATMAATTQPSTLLADIAPQVPGAIIGARNHVVNTLIEGTPEIEAQLRKDALANPPAPRERDAWGPARVDPGRLAKDRRLALQIASHTPIVGPTLHAVGEAWGSSDPEKIGEQVPAMIGLASMSPTARALTGAATKGVVSTVANAPRRAARVIGRNPETAARLAGATAGLATGTVATPYLGPFGPVAGAAYGFYKGGSPLARKTVDQIREWGRGPNGKGTLVAPTTEESLLAGVEDLRHTMPDVDVEVPDQPVVRVGEPEVSSRMPPTRDASERAEALARIQAEDQPAAARRTAATAAADAGSRPFSFTPAIVKETPAPRTAAPRTPAPPKSITMEQGMRAMGRQGRRELEDIEAGRTMTARMATKPEPTVTIDEGFAKAAEQRISDPVILDVLAKEKIAPGMSRHGRRPAMVAETKSATPAGPATSAGPAPGTAATATTEAATAAGEAPAASAANPQTPAMATRGNQGRAARDPALKMSPDDLGVYGTAIREGKTHEQAMAVVVTERAKRHATKFAAAQANAKAKRDAAK